MLRTQIHSKMTENRKVKGLSVGTKAPVIETQDVFGNDINLTNLLKNHRGVLIDFFRAAW